MFAFAETLTHWTAENRFSQLRELKTISIDFYNLVKNYTVVFEPFIQNAYLHETGIITNLITNQRLYRLDARFPEFIFDITNQINTKRKIINKIMIVQSCSECIENNALFSIGVVDDRFYARDFDLGVGCITTITPFMRNAKNLLGFILKKNVYVVITRDVFAVRTSGKKFLYIQKPNVGITQAIISSIDQNELVIKYLYDGKIHELSHQIRK